MFHLAHTILALVFVRSPALREGQQGFRLCRLVESCKGQCGAEDANSRSEYPVQRQRSLPEALS